eukprot:1156913-Pelagomonas_calceolata.AAC.2
MRSLRRVLTARQAGLGPEPWELLPAAFMGAWASASGAAASCFHARIMQHGEPTWSGLEEKAVSATAMLSSINEKFGMPGKAWGASSRQTRGRQEHQQHPKASTSSRNTWTIMNLEPQAHLAKASFQRCNSKAGRKHKKHSGRIAAILCPLGLQCMLTKW